MTSLVWMRRDLRLNDHAALATALAGPSPVQPLFIFDTTILARFANPNDRRLSFIAAALCQIDSQLRARGGQLLILRGKPEEILPRLATAISATAIVTAEDFEPATRARDAAVQRALPSTTRFVQLVDHLLLAPPRTVKDDGSPYKVFTPFYKRWRAMLGPEDVAEYQVRDTGRYALWETITKALSAASLHPLPVEQGPGALLEAVGYRYQPDPLWKVENAPALLDDFISHRLRDYPTARDQLAINGTSRMSPYLRHGLISIRQCARAAMESGVGEKWLSELGWREFYASILYYFPEVVTQEFITDYRDGAIPWISSGPLCQAFMEGRTGFPVVDAAVRELLTTGTMHNRARMIAASFATKDLLMDWRVGEEFFAQHLMDYDLASNNGGWQWAASTGTDAAPYFRVFNPVLQGKKFDPDGSYVRRHVPELAAMRAVDIHAPWKTLEKPAGYPLPIVDHAAARDRVIAAFKHAGRATGI